MSASGVGEADPDQGSLKARPEVLAFGAPVHILSSPFGGGEAFCVATIDDALAVVASAGPLRFAADGRERAEWALALEYVASAKFERTSDAVEAARVALRSYARSAGILATIQSVGRAG